MEKEKIDGILAYKQLMDTNTFEPYVIALLENNMVVKAPIIAITEPAQIEPSKFIQQLIENNQFKTEINTAKFFVNLKSEDNEGKLQTFLNTHYVYEFLRSHNIDVEMIYGPVHLDVDKEIIAKSVILPHDLNILPSFENKKVYLYQILHMQADHSELHMPVIRYKFRGHIEDVNEVVPA